MSECDYIGCARTDTEPVTIRLTDPQGVVREEDLYAVCPEHRDNTVIRVLSQKWLPSYDDHKSTT